MSAHPSPEYQPLEAQSDEILAKIPRDRDQPHYTKDTFDRKMRRAWKRLQNDLQTAQPEPISTVDLKWSELSKLMEEANLTVRQEEVLLARARGDSWVEIGERHGHTKQGAVQIFKQAAQKLRRAWKRSPTRGIHEVYLSEVSRFSIPR